MFNYSKSLTNGAAQKGTIIQISYPRTATPIDMHTLIQKLRQKSHSSISAMRKRPFLSQ